MLSHYPIETYSPERIQEAFLIIHPKILERYDITREEFHNAFERGSNFSQLKHPIADEYGLEYYDSEWYYMAQRVGSVAQKQAIALASRRKWASKSEAYKYKAFMNHNNEDRIAFMRNTIQKKYDGSKWRRKGLLDTASREIIEFTYWFSEYLMITGKDVISLENSIWNIEIDCWGRLENKN